LNELSRDFIGLYHINRGTRHITKRLTGYTGNLAAQSFPTQTYNMKYILIKLLLIAISASLFSQSPAAAKCISQTEDTDHVAEHSKTVAMLCTREVAVIKYLSPGTNEVYSLHKNGPGRSYPPREITGRKKISTNFLAIGCIDRTSLLGIMIVGAENLLSQTARAIKDYFNRSISMLQSRFAIPWSKKERPSGKPLPASGVKSVIFFPSFQRL
jgi:hypothetical protein